MLGDMLALAIMVSRCAFGRVDQPASAGPDRGGAPASRVW